MLGKIFNNTDLLEKGLDASWLRNEVIANNIANADTPGFKSSSVKFESLLSDALNAKSDDFVAKRTRDKHISFDDSNSSRSIDPVVVQNTDTTMRMDGNNVDIDYEQTELAKNQIYYNMVVQKLNMQMSRIKTAIRGS